MILSSLTTFAFFFGKKTRSLTWAQRVFFCMDGQMSQYPAFHIGEEGELVSLRDGATRWAYLGSEAFEPVDVPQLPSGHDDSQEA